MSRVIELLDEAIEFIKKQNISHHDDGRDGLSECSHCDCWDDHEDDCEIGKILAERDEIERLGL